ncbi:MAG: type II toxin-antitoxin system RelE/ParE family toxin [Caulobacteraceae bacterium]|nr:type II toxin-antitoxin system RelE/ParE family toxin [Caulobacteraceae bacterium]
MKVILSRQAQRDFAVQVRWLHEHSPQVGRRALDRIVETLDLLSDFPDLGAEVSPGIREKQIQFGRDGFVIRYRRAADKITVLRIYHSMQNRS